MSNSLRNQTVILNSADKLIHLFLVFTLYQLALHMYFAFSAHDPRLFVPTLVAYIHDVSVLAIISALAYSMTSLSGPGHKNLANRIAAFIMILTGVLLSAYPKLLREYLVFPVNIFESDAGSFKTFLLDYLGLLSLLPSLIGFILGVIVYLINFPWHFSKKIPLYGFIILLVIFGFTLKKTSPQPFIYSLQTEIAGLLKGEERVVPSLHLKAANNESGAIGQLVFPAKDEIKYNHILLIVLEGVIADSFEQGFLTIPARFYSRHKNNSVYYNNYYTNNLDSYTSLIAMITSIMVPYRSYADTDIYDSVNTAPSLTEDFHRRGFTNSFISCYQYQPFVPTRKYWDKIYERKDLPSLEKWLTLGSSKMEMATEDKAAISTITDIVKSNKKSFILHEMVYGHSPEWRAKTGMTQNEYHNEYLMDLWQNLEAEKLIDQTLFIIVSDHGDRAKSSEIDNYRIPLLITGHDLSYQLRNEWLSHLDLPGIIYHYVMGDQHPESRTEMFFVGSTEKWVYGTKNNQGEYLFIDNGTGVILAQSGNIKANDVMYKFQQYLNMFNAVYVNKE